MTKKLFTPVTLLIIFVSFSLQHGFAFSVVRPLPVETTTPAYLRADVFVKMSAQDFANVTGTKLNFFQRIYFKVVKHQLKRELRRDPDLLITDYYDKTSHKFKFDALWFVIGAFIGPLGVLLSYYSHQQKNGPNKKDRTTSAWLGFALFVVWFGVLFVF